MVDRLAAPVGKLAEVLGTRYGTKIEAAHFRRATNSELSEWMGQIGKRQPTAMRKVNEAVLKLAANQDGGANAFLVSGFEHKKISELAITSVDFRVRIGGFLVHHGWWTVNDGAIGEAGESDNTNPCFHEFGPGSYLDLTDTDDLPTADEIRNCFCVQECVDCDDAMAGMDNCEGACN